jgi:predicted TPR repeat methyltransferase
MSESQTLAQAFAYLESGRLSDARRLARGLESARPEPPALPYLLGLLALAEGQGRKAAQHLTRAAIRTPGAIPPLLALARSQTQQQRTPEAVAAYRRLLAVAPDLAVAWQELADTVISAGDLKTAQAPLVAAARLLPSHALLRNNLGIAARANGDLSQAEASFKAAILLDPTQSKPYANRAALLRHCRRSAVADAGRALALSADAAAHLELGQALAEAGDHETALPHFAQASDLLPALWLQAETLRHMHRADEAAALYRTLLQKDPDDHFGANLALAQISGAVPAGAAKAHVEALYDQYAGSFERNLLTELAYRGPEIILDGIERAGLSGPFDIFDAGCGTGLMGAAIKPQAKTLTGIDLSAKMAAQARGRGIYDEVLVGDLISALRARPAAFDLVLAADVLIYFGDLREVITAAAIALRPGGAFAFTVERSEREPVALLSTGRFAHSAEHLERAAAGWQTLLLEPTTTRREKDLPVPGLLCILRKP